MGIARERGEDTKKHLFFLVDNVIQNYKTKKAFDK
jgi:hypothetical protein